MIQRFRGRVFCALFAVPFIASGVACKPADSDAPVVPPTVSSPDEKLVAYNVTGMTCSGCEKHLTDEFSKLPKVKEARASHKDKKVWIVVKGDAPSMDAVREAVKAAGSGYKLDGES